MPRNSTALNEKLNPVVTVMNFLVLCFYQHSLGWSVAGFRLGLYPRRGLVRKWVLCKTQAQHRPEGARSDGRYRGKTKRADFAHLLNALRGRASPGWLKS